MADKQREPSNAYMAFTSGRTGLDARELRRVQSPHDHRVWRMPVPIWTLALWFSVAVVVVIFSFVLPFAADAPVGPRLFAAAYATLAVAVLVVAAARTPVWFIHMQLLASIGFMVWFTALAPSNAGAVTSMMMTIVLAGYAAYTLPYLQAIAYVSVASAVLLTTIILGHLAGVLFLPWTIVTAISFAQVLILGVLVGNLKRQVVIDPLTGLLNRAGLNYATSDPGPYSHLDPPRAILVMDLDGFKAVNDQGGHAAGDKVLQQVGEAVLRVCRRDDLAIRCGGDEFILVMPQTDEASAGAVADRLTKEVLAPCSMGVALWEPDEELHHAIGRADDRMYEDKAQRKRDRISDVAGS